MPEVVAGLTHAMGGNMAVDEDSYTEKYAIAMVWLTEARFGGTGYLSALTAGPTLGAGATARSPSKSAPCAGQWSHAGVDTSQDMGHVYFSFPMEKLACTFVCVWQPICFLQVSVNLVCICHRSQRQLWHAPKLGLGGGWPVGRQLHLWHHDDFANGQN